MGSDDWFNLNWPILNQGLDPYKQIIKPGVPFKTVNEEKYFQYIFFIQPF